MDPSPPKKDKDQVPSSDDEKPPAEHDGGSSDSDRAETGPGRSAASEPKVIDYSSFEPEFVTDFGSQSLEAPLTSPPKESGYLDDLKRLAEPRSSTRIAGVEATPRVPGGIASDEDARSDSTGPQDETFDAQEQEGPSDTVQSIMVDRVMSSFMDWLDMKLKLKVEDEKKRLSKIKDEKERLSRIEDDKKRLSLRFARKPRKEESHETAPKEMSDMKSFENKDATDDRSLSSSGSSSRSSRKSYVEPFGPSSPRSSVAETVHHPRVRRSGSSESYRQSTGAIVSSPQPRQKRKGPRFAWFSTHTSSQITPASSLPPAAPAAHAAAAVARPPPPKGHAVPPPLVASLPPNNDDDDDKLVSLHHHDASDDEEEEEAVVYEATSIESEEVCKEEDDGSPDDDGLPMLGASWDMAVAEPSYSASVPTTLIDEQSDFALDVTEPVRDLASGRLAKRFSAVSSGIVPSQPPPLQAVPPPQAAPPPPAAPGAAARRRLSKEEKELRTAKRGRSDNENREEHAEEGGDGNRPPRAKLPKVREDEVSGAKLACPFFKHNPRKYKNQRPCCGPGWDHVHRIKEHIYRKHSLPKFSCPRCSQPFETQSDLQAHARLPDPCEVREPEILDGITQDQEKKLRSRKKTSAKELTEAEKWTQAYSILFPDVREREIPSPYYNTEDAQTNLGGYEDYLRRELPPLVRRQLEKEVERELSFVEEGMKQKVIEIARNLQMTLFRGYQQLENEEHGSADPSPSSGCETGGSSFAATTDTSPSTVTTAGTTPEMPDPLDIFGADSTIPDFDFGFLSEVPFPEPHAPSKGLESALEFEPGYPPGMELLGGQQGEMSYYGVGGYHDGLDRASVPAHAGARFPYPES